jgi:hypothetical protein
MADNIAISAGTGTSVATDDVSGVHFQKVKIDLGGDGASSPLGVGQQAMAASVPVAIASNQSAVPASGDVAHDAADSGNPQKVGGMARTTNPTAVADADRVNAIFDKLGKQIAVGAIRELKGHQQTSLANSTTETAIVTAGGAGVFHDLYGLVLSNTGSTATSVSIRDATAGTVRAIFEVPAGDTRGIALPVDSGLNQAAANTAWTAQCDAATSNLEVTALFVKNL